MRPERRRGTGAAGLLIVPLLVACSTLLPEPDAALPIDGLDVEPRPVDARDVPNVAVGPVVELARGEVDGDPMAMTVYRSADGPCISLSTANGSGVGCGLLPGEMPELGPFGLMTVSHGAHDAGLPVEVSGLVADEVASVWVAMPGGVRARALMLSLEPAEMEGTSAFLVFLAPGASPAALLALDGDGEVLETEPLAQRP